MSPTYGVEAEVTLIRIILASPNEVAIKKINRLIDFSLLTLRALTPLRHLGACVMLWYLFLNFSNFKHSDSKVKIILIIISF